MARESTLLDEVLPDYDVSATYSNLFIRVNATAGSTGGADTHTHAAGSYIGPVHTHTLNTSPLDETAGTTTMPTGSTTDSGGGGAITGTSASGSNIPSFLTAKLCKVN